MSDPSHSFLDASWIFGLTIILFSIFYLIGLYLQNTNNEYQCPEVGSFLDLRNDDENMDMTDEELLEWYKK